MADREIKVRINGDTSGLENGLSRGQRNLVRFAKVGAAAVAAVGAAVGAALVAMTRRSFQNVDALTKQARSLGLTTAALQNMSMVAGEAGVSTEQLSGMLGLMQRNIIELQKGTQAQTDAFGRLGLSIRDLQGLTPDEQFRRIAESLNGIEDPALKTATAMEIFGRSGRAAINMLDDYSRKVDEAADFNRRFNVEVSEIDAAKIEAANDAWGRVTTALTGVGNTIATWVAPAITRMSELMLVGIEYVINFGDKMRDLASIASQVWGNMANGGRALFEILKAVANGIAGAFVGAFAWIAEKWDALINAMSGAFNELMEAAGADFRLGSSGIGEDLRAVQGDLNATAIAAADTAKSLFELSRSPIVIPMRVTLADGNPDRPGEGGGGSGGGGVDDPEVPVGGGVVPGVGGAAAVTNAMADRLNALVTGLMTEQETIAAWYSESRATLDDALLHELLTREQYAEAVERLEEEHQRRLQGIREMGNKWGVQAALKGGSEILGAMGQMNEKALRASKVFAAAEALVSTYQGAAAELKAGTFGFASAAAVIARGIGFVSAIKSVSASGGGGGSRGSGSAAAPASPAQAQQPATTFAFNIQNDGMGIGENVIRQIIEQLNSTSRDGGRVQAVMG